MSALEATRDRCLPRVGQVVVTPTDGITQNQRILPSNRFQRVISGIDLGVRAFPRGLAEIE